jgi:uncharacterized pyridoxamine 5'-phosphate oxidase family protein
MENKIIKIIVFLVLSTNIFAQKTKQDTLKMFEGHWIFKLAMNSDYTPQELEDTYLKDARGGKIHVKGNKIYGNFDASQYENFDLDIKNMPTNGGKEFLNDEFDKKDLFELKKLGIEKQSWMGFYQTPYKPITLPYFSIQLLLKQQYLKIGMDQTMFFLERDKSEYKFIGVIETLILGEDKKPTLNKILENEEVEILEKGKEYSKIRYWGKALIIGWVKTMDLKDGTSHPEYWNIYKENSIKFKVLSTKSFIYDNLFQKTDSYLIKGDTIEVLEEKGFYLKIKYNNIIGFIPRIDVEGYNTFRITKSKATLHSSLSVPTKMYLLKGDDIELIDRAKDWLKIRYYGKKVVEGWIKQSDVE